MTWIKLEDTFPTDPKILGLSDRGFRLYIAGLCYCARHLTDGHIPDAAIVSFACRRRAEVVRELCSAGLWEEAPDGGWDVHNYLLYQRSKDQVETERDQAKQRKQKQRSRRDTAVTSRRDKSVTTPDVTPSVTLQEKSREEPSSSPPAHHDPPAANGAASGGEEDQVGQTLTAVFDHMAECDYETAATRGTIRDPAAWKRKAADNRRASHEADARHELGQRTHGIHYPLHVEIAETLDPACGPDDGGKARADAQHQATLHMLDEQRKGA